MSAPPDDLALHPGCGLTPPCASQAEMRERHGTPAAWVWTTLAATAEDTAA